MQAHQVDVKWNTPKEQLKRATAKLAEQNRKNREILSQIDFRSLCR